MIDHISLRVSDFARAVEFYRTALAPLGYRVVMEFPDAAGLGEPGKPDLWLMKSEGPINPTHVSFTTNRDSVDAFHGAALAAGGTDNGAPGPRPNYHPHYYGAFVLDPDGNNIEAVCHVPPGSPPSARKASARKAAPKAAGKKAAPKKAAAKAAGKAAAKMAAPKKAAAKKSNAVKKPAKPAKGKAKVQNKKKR